MDSMYDNYFSGIKEIYKKIQNYKEKLIFLIDERGSFRVINKNENADIIMQWFTDEIEKVKILGQSEYNPSTSISENQLTLLDIKQENQKTLLSQQEKVKTLKEPITESNIILSNIEDWLFPLKEETILTNTNYNNLVVALNHYFENGKFPKLDNQISVRRVNIKRFGWALNEIFRANTNNNENLPIDYLKFAKENISIFIDVSFDENNYLKSNLYKYFTTKTK